MSNITRREFLEDSILAAAAAASLPLPVLAEERHATSANDKITVAIIGCGFAANNTRTSWLNYRTARSPTFATPIAIAPPKSLLT